MKGLPVIGESHWEVVMTIPPAEKKGLEGEEGDKEWGGWNYGSRKSLPKIVHL